MVPPPVALVLVILIEPVATVPPTVTVPNGGGRLTRVRKSVPTPDPPGVTTTENGTSEIVTCPPPTRTRWTLAVPAKVAWLLLDAKVTLDKDGRTSNRTTNDEKDNKRIARSFESLVVVVLAVAK